MTSSPLPSEVDPSLVRARRRSTVFLLSGVGICTVGYIASITVTTLVAKEISGSPTWAGSPVAAAVLGTATGAPLLSALMQRWGRRLGLMAAYGLIALGGALAVVATGMASFALLMGGLFVLGVGNSGNALTRYLVADLHPLERRGFALSLAVWMGTIGAVLGPNLLAPAGRAAAAVGLPPLSGAYLIALLLATLVASIYAFTLRPDPLELVVDTHDPAAARDSPRLGSVLRLPQVQIALATMLVGHTAMILIMTMTPVYLEQAEHHLGRIGLVMSAHIFGMFAFSPLIGRVVDRVGEVPMILLAQATLLAAAFLAATSPPTSLAGMIVALFLLGLGWNFGFVAGSALLTAGQPLAVRSKLQGYADAAVWTSAAVASLASSLVLAGFGYRGLCVLGGALVVVPLSTIAMHARAARSANPAR